MGLDVTAFAQAQLVDSEEAGQEIYNANGIDRMDGKPEGRYIGVNEFSFRAGSYGGYNAFRDWLCKTFLRMSPEPIWKYPERYATRPFVELINFGDNEGSFGPMTSAKLAKDFQTHTPPNCKDDYRSTYLKFQKAFEIASDDGFVKFH